MHIGPLYYFLQYLNLILSNKLEYNQGTTFYVHLAYTKSIIEFMLEII